MFSLEVYTVLAQAAAVQKRLVELQEGDTGLLLLIQLVSLRVDQLVDTLDENQFVLGELHSTMPRRLLVRVKLALCWVESALDQLERERKRPRWLRHTAHQDLTQNLTELVDELTSTFNSIEGSITCFCSIRADVDQYGALLERLDANVLWANKSATRPRRPARRSASVGSEAGGDDAKEVLPGRKRKTTGEVWVVLKKRSLGQRRGVST